MTAPRRIRLSRARGWRLPDNAVNVARPGRWGNPFVVGQDGTRLQCAAKFALLAGGFIAFSDQPDPDAQLALWRRIRRDVTSLAGKDLACWCALDGGGCHGDVLLHLANPGSLPPEWMRGPIELPRIRLGLAATDFEKLRRKARTKGAAGS
ncbi:MAG: DUF4326 domain-containing protein [Sphingomonadales bacterium]|nr:DUF4326 domain-containing protein [Sphingomonadales bacterium]MBU3993734.1 DUF4326 domain-containing protein [Alphaproteobacteria bacterium]